MIIANRGIMFNSKKNKQKKKRDPFVRYFIKSYASTFKTIRTTLSDGG